MGKLLNIGCGNRFVPGNGWTNMDMQPASPEVIKCNFRNGIPFKDESFEVVYHSHVLEHIPKDEVDFFMKECIRVLSPNGIMRIAIPDLEQIARNYLKFLENGWSHFDSDEIAANYEWTMLEMYDQTVRNKSGGEMIKFLSQDHLINEEFVVRRCGSEVKKIIQNYKTAKNNPPQADEINQIKNNWLKSIYRFCRHSDFRRDVFLKFFWGKDGLLTFRNGLFRQQGEIHQWMYDRYSLKRLMQQHHLRKINQQKPDESYLENWKTFNLDTEPDGSIYKPDSLFMEAIK